MLSAASADIPGPEPASTVPGDAFPLRRFEGLPEFPSPRLLPVRFPDATPVARVHRLTVHGERLWLAAVPRADTNLPPDAGRLWAFDARNNRLLPVRGLIEQHGVFSLLGRSDGLWMALDGGLAVMSPATLVIDPFGPAQGITGSTFAGLAEAGGRLFALSATGAGYGLNRDGRSWARLDGEPDPNPRRATRWSGLASAGDWLLARAPDALALRHQGGAAWHPVDTADFAMFPSRSPSGWTAAVGDGDGAFWIGSSAGLHFLVAETGSMENRITPMEVRVPGGLTGPVPPGFQPAASAAAQVAERVADGIRSRMRDRARMARVRLETGRALDPVTPTSRVPGPVSALAPDGPYLWVVTRDGTPGEPSRVSLFHAASRRWVGSFPVSLPVLDVAVDDRFLWLGLDASAVPRGAPLVAVDKRPLLAVSADRWVEDEPTPEERGEWLAGLPVRERAVLAFFAGDAARVVALLGPESEPPDPEVEFLLAFAHDAVGLDRPAIRDRHLERLHRLFPSSPHAVATRHLRPGPSSPSVAAEAPTHPPAPKRPEATNTSSLPVPPPSLPPTVPVPGEPDPVAAILARRDLNKDGRLNLVEWRLWHGPAAEIRGFDTDGDGHLDAAELAAALGGRE